MRAKPGRGIRVYFISIMAFFLCAGVGFGVTYGGGSGTAADPYQIWTAEQLNEIGSNTADYNKYFILMADVDLSGYDGQEGRPVFSVIARDTNASSIGFQGTQFSGSFDGKGHRISNFSCVDWGRDYAGLFGYIASSGQIRNLRMDHVAVRAQSRSYVGGLAGYSKGTITQCGIEGTISGNLYIGGLAGENEGTVTQCRSSAAVTAVSDYAGGLIGLNYGPVSHCYSTGSVTGVRYIGGLFGHATSSITACYSAGTVTGTIIGGLVGTTSPLYPVTIVNCFWDVQASGAGTSSGGGTGKTTAAMQQIPTFLDWSKCSSQVLWTIDASHDYPRLEWEQAVGVPLPSSAKDMMAGTGTESDPFQIATVEQMYSIGAFACDMDKCFVLTADLDMASLSGVPYRPFVDFRGIFDGNGHTISNLTADMPTEAYDVGMFAWINSTGQVKNLALVNASIRGKNSVGAIAGYNAGIISNCSVQGTIIGESRVGGLVGTQSNGTILGNQSKGTIHRCSAAGTVTVSGKNPSFNSSVGGLVGLNDGGAILESRSSGDVTSSSRYVGGLVGSNQGQVLDCYATGKVTGPDYVGGLAGEDGGIIVYSYSIGRVTSAGLNSGGMIGLGRNFVIDSFWDIQASERTTSSGGTGKTTAEMKQISTYSGWGYCGGIWTLQEGAGYPSLAWEGQAGTPIVELFPWAGSGTVENPYQVSTAEELDAVGKAICAWDRCFVLTNDIDLSAYSGQSLHLIGSYPYLPFTGSFDGQGHIFANLTYEGPGYWYVGLFRYVETGMIRGITLTDAHLVAGNYVGGIAGFLKKGTIQDCSLTGSVTGTQFYYSGGIAGYNSEGTLTRCRADGLFSGISYVAGIAGSNDHGILSDCRTGGTVQGSVDYIGGVTGSNNNGSIKSCYSNAKVSGVGGYVGGLAGESQIADISDSCASGDVSGGNMVGGLVGFAYQSSVLNCYSVGAVSGETRIGGLIGHSDTATFDGSVWDITASGRPSSAGGIGKTTGEMKMLSTFTGAGWDFVGESANGTGDVWRMCVDGVSYPRLCWEFSQNGDMACPDGVGMNDLLYFSARWMATTAAMAGAADANGDGKIGMEDFGVMGENWGK
jgi:hypothetical protein